MSTNCYRAGCRWMRSRWGANRHLRSEGLRHAAAMAADPLLVRVHRHRVPLCELPQILQLHAGRKLRPALRRGRAGQA